ncbi:hypothetical protein LAZ67_18001660 [Cordylochernes scorpioides]|uniref:RRM domain-containing protein n=1 Tax=Cordylochernes scorpioides TaxID=51811 RepID=A0ABY6LFY4_9ARAC|nr:hypothetical protein LAZ67_18001660 [Cordylochernes scorpioides]
MSKSRIKTMIIVFFDIRGIVHWGGGREEAKYVWILVGPPKDPGRAIQGSWQSHPRILVGPSKDPGRGHPRILEEEEEEDEDEEEEEIDEMKTESYRLNELGKNLALEERFQEAITYFTEAIELNPSQPSNSLEYVKSEECFLKVLELEPNCPDARQELYTIKMLQLMDMGITAEQARAALAVNSTVEQATEWIYEGNCPNFPSVDEERMRQFPEVVVPERKPQPAAPSSRTNSTPNTTPSSTYNHIDIKMDPRNPEKSSTLWVGNIGADLQEKALRNLFAKYGTVISHKVVKDPAKNRNYAFINFSNPESASNAMKALQGKFFGGDNLRLRFPDNTKASKNNSDTKPLAEEPVTLQVGCMMLKAFRMRGLMELQDQ